MALKFLQSNTDEYSHQYGFTERLNLKEKSLVNAWFCSEKAQSHIYIYIYIYIYFIKINTIFRLNNAFVNFLYFPNIIFKSVTIKGK